MGFGGTMLGGYYGGSNHSMAALIVLIVLFFYVVGMFIAQFQGYGSPNDSKGNFQMMTNHRP